MRDRDDHLWPTNMGSEAQQSLQITPREEAQSASGLCRCVAPAIVLRSLCYPAAVFTLQTFLLIFSL